jgi:hypothetical protein
MQNKQIRLLATLLLLSFVAWNCTSIGHDASMKSQLSVSTDEHKNIARPLEVTHDIQSANITGEAEGSILWIPIVFDVAVGGFGLVGQVLGTVVSGVGSGISAIPVVGKNAGASVKNSGNTVSNLGPIISNALILPLAQEAENKAIFSNNIDGLMRTRVEAAITTKWLILKNYKVTVTGKPVTIKTIGPISEARLAKIATFEADAKYEDKK